MRKCLILLAMALTRAATATAADGPDPALLERIRDCLSSSEDDSAPTPTALPSDIRLLPSDAKLTAVTALAAEGRIIVVVANGDGELCIKGGWPQRPMARGPFGVTRESVAVYSVESAPSGRDVDRSEGPGLLVLQRPSGALRLHELEGCSVDSIEPIRLFSGRQASLRVECSEGGPARAGSRIELHHLFEDGLRRVLVTESLDVEEADMEKGEDGVQRLCRYSGRGSLTVRRGNGQPSVVVVTPEVGEPRGIESIWTWEPVSRVFTKSPDEREVRARGSTKCEAL